MLSRLVAMAAVLLGTASAARAQAPGQTPPLGKTSSEYHAVPPLQEVFPSPRPTLPPPARSGETGGQIGVVLDHGGFSTVLGEDGSIDFVDHHLGGGALVLLAWLSFDATDEAMRAANQDPYALDKLRIMQATFDERMVVRRQHDKIVMRRALDDLPAYLDAVWQQRAWTPESRRRILFALWDETAEEGNALLVAGGAEARATIEQFIARTLPPGSRHAFSGDELAELNRIRTSRRAFAPYRGEPPARPREPEENETPVAGPPPLVAAALRGL